MLRDTKIKINRRRFTLTLSKQYGPIWVRMKKYKITVGALGTETPPGRYMVDNKSRKPDWLAPDGRIIKYGEPGNPFYGGFISFYPKRGIGIHGVVFPAHVGEMASHGCIRMRKKDILNIYDLVPIGAKVVVR